MSLRQRMATAIAAVAILAPGVLVTPAGATTPLVGDPSTITEQSALDLEFTGIEPLIIVSGDTAVITASLVNRSQVTLKDVEVVLSAQGWTPNQRENLVRWLDGETYDPAIILGRENFEILGPGGRATMTFEVPAERFLFDAWGPRGIEITASAEGSAGDRERSFVLWWNDQVVEPTSISVVAPVAQSAGDLANDSTTRVDALLHAEYPAGLSLVVEPSIQSGREVDAVLPWLNADPEGLLMNAPEAYSEAVTRATASGRPVLTWLAEPSEELLAADAELGDAVLVPESAISAEESLPFTPNAVVRTDPLPIAVIDDALTDLLAGRAYLDGHELQLSDVEQRQLFTATTAVITRERPYDGRTVIAALDWEWSVQDADLLAVLDEAPWVEPITLAEALASVPWEREVSLPETSAAPDGMIDADTFTRIGNIHVGFDDVSTLASEVAERVASLRGTLDPLVSRSYRSDPAARDRKLDQAQWLIDYYLGSVAITGPVSGVNMISTESDFPVSVSNTLPHAVDVTVSLTPSDPRMQSPTSVDATIPAIGTSQVLVPVAGVGWGDFVVDATAYTPTGRMLSEPHRIDVRLLASVEDWAVIAIVSLAVVALAFGIFRTVRRNRRIGRSEIIDAAAAELDEILEAERSDSPRDPHRETP